MGTQGAIISTAVLPDTDYWLWIGHYEEPANTAVKQYGATVCATQVTP